MEDEWRQGWKVAVSMETSQEKEDKKDGILEVGEEIGSADETDPDYTEYITGKKIPAGGIPGLDLSDPKQLTDFARIKPKKERHEEGQLRHEGTQGL